MIIYDFDQYVERRGTESLKWRLYDGDVLPMWVADMDFKAPQPVIDALMNRIEHGVFGYPIESEELLQAVVERMHRRFHWEIKSEDILLLTDVIVGFNLACHAAAEPGDGLLIQTPVYPPFFSTPANTQMQLQVSELSRAADGSYHIDMDRFEGAINEKTSVFLMCNPHNPVGRVFTREELVQMAETCLRHRLTIVSDEIHEDLVFRGYHHIPIASLDPEVAQHTVTLIAPSKTYNVPGLKCSICIVQNQELREKIKQSTKGLTGHVNIMGMTAALAAYRHGQEWLDQALAYLEANRDYLCDFINARMPGVTMARPEGTFLAWLDCRSLVISENASKFFLEKARVALNNGETFGQGGEGFVRMNFACPRNTLTTGLERMRDALLALEHGSWPLKRRNAGAVS